MADRIGDENDNVLVGTEFADLLQGLGGDDTLTGGKGDDDIQGGDGDDLMIWNNGDGSDLMEGGAGNDTVQVNAADGAGDTFTVTEDAGRVDFTRTNLGLFSLDIGTTEILDVNGQDGDDVIDASGLNASLISLDFDGGEGNDVLIGGDGNDLLQGGAGDDTITGGKGDDDIQGGDGDDLMIWNNGDGSDTMDGGAGNDVVQVNAADGAGDTFTVTEDAGRVDFARTNLGLFSLDIGTTETLDVNGQGGDDVIDATGLGAGLISLDFDGGAGNDILKGGDGADTLSGGDGDDTLVGSGGGDTLIGGAGNDTIFTANENSSNSSGIDFVDAGDGNDNVFMGSIFTGDEFIGGAGIDTIHTQNFRTTVDLAAGTIEDFFDNATISEFENVQGASRDDTFSGTDGTNVLNGGGGDDILDGREGDDTLNGGNGNDTLIGGEGADSLDGFGGQDTADYSASDAGVTIDLDAGTASGGHATGDTFQGVDGLIGSAFADSLTGFDAQQVGGANAFTNIFEGGAGDDTLDGKGGDDTLIGDTGNDTIIGGSGDDLMIWNNGDGSDTMDGGAGNDTVQVNAADGAGDNFVISDNGGRVEFERTNLGLFTLDIGSTETLEVNGQGGDDVIDGSGLLSNLIDLQLTGGTGNDTKIGGDGDDLLIWNNGDGSDFMEGGDGDDRVQVNAADGAGDNFVITEDAGRVDFARTNLGLFSLDIGTVETLEVNGQGGDDIVDGSALTSGLIALDLDGGEGNDQLTGGNLADRLEGGAGDDTLIGGKGDDTMLGGDGDDRIIWNNGDGSDFIRGGDGFDTLEINLSDGEVGDIVSLSGGIQGVTFARENLIPFTLNINQIDRFEINGGAGDDQVTVAGGIGAVIDGGAGDDTLIGSGRGDTFIGGEGADDIQGGGGSDTLDFSGSLAGVTVILDGAGDGVGVGGDAEGDTYDNLDNITGSEFDDVISSNANKVRLEGLGGNDTITGGRNFDFLSGGDGDDTINASGGQNDTLDGGTGADTFNGDARDVVTYGSAAVGVKADLLNASFNTGDAAGDTYNGIRNLSGSDFNDNLRGDGEANVLSGLAGNDLLIGRDGDDTLRGGEGNDNLFGGAGADTLEGGDGIDIANYSDSSAGLTVDLQFAGSNTGIGDGDTYSEIESLIGSNFDDSLRGDGGDNRIEGRNGDDILFGRDGDDTLIGGNGDDIMLGGLGADALFGGAGSGDRAQYTDATAGVTADLQNSAFNRGDFAIGDTFSQIEDIRGSNFGDDLRGQALDNTLFGGNGNDFLVGRLGDDTLLGGNDNDVLTGGAGADVLNGGAGVDQANYIDGISGVTADLQFSQFNTGIAAGDTYINVENLRGSRSTDILRGDAEDNKIDGFGGDDVINGRDGNDELRGGVGNDILIGGAGDDLLVGSVGNDVYRFNAPAEGVDTIQDMFSGVDTIHLNDAGFTALSRGALDASNFRAGEAAVDADDFIIYDSATGNLFYDADGAGGADQILFATILNTPTLDEGDFFIV